MKKVALILLAGLLLLSAAVVAQMPADAKVYPLGEAGTLFENAEPGVRGGTLYRPNIEDPKGWNGVIAHETSTTGFTNLMFDGLVGFNQISAAYVPEIAKSYEISEDGLTLTFYLREGILWSDGEPLTSADVAFTYNDLLMNEDIDTDSRDGLELPDGSYPVLEVIDDYTIAFHMSVIFRPVFNSLSFDIMPEHALAQYVAKLNPDLEPGYFNTYAWPVDMDLSELVCNGPYIVTDYQPNASVTLERNPNYYGFDSQGTQLPYYDKVIDLIVSNQDVSLLKFRNGEVDAYAARPEDIPVLLPDANTKGYTVMVTDDPLYGTTWICVNMDIGLADGTDAEKREVYRNVIFRQALAHTLDKETMVANVLNGLGAPQWSPVSLGSPFYAGRDIYGGPVTENNAVWFEYDLALAGQLLDSIGVVDADGDGWRDLPSGAPLEIEINTNDNTTRSAYCLIIQDDLRAVGLNANFQVVDFNTLVTRLLGGTGDIVQLGLTGNDEPNSGSNVYNSCGGLHAYRLSACDDPNEEDLRINELYNLGAGTFDNDEAFGYYTEVQQVLANQLGYIYLVNQTFNYAVYNYVGNGHLASTTSTPTGANGYLIELLFDKRL